MNDLTEDTQKQAEVTHTLEKSTDVAQHLGNIGYIIAEASLRIKGWYSCTIAGVKTLFIVGGAE